MTPRKWTVLALVALLGAAPALAQTQTPPPGAQPKDFSLPQRQSFTLENGLAATLVAYGTLPKVTVSVRVRCGNGNETADQVWLADLTGNMMQEGTATKDAAALAAAFAEMGGELNIQVGNDLTTITTDVLQEFGPEAVKLLAEIARHPSLPASELDRLKNDLVRDLSLDKAQPQPLANEKFAQALYGDHPYGRLFPTEEMIRGYDLDAVRGFYQKNFGAKRTRVYVVGVFEARAMEKAIRDGFADWAAGPEPLVDIPEMKTKKVVYLIDRPDAPQSTLRIGLPVVDPSDPDYTSLIVTNTLLGGFFSSRVTSNIREDKGYTYSPNSQVVTNYRAAHWVQNADVTTAVTGAALKEIFYEIERLQKEAPPADELEGVENYMSGVFVLRNSSRNGIVNQLSFVDLHGLSDDYLTGYVSRVHAVTPEKVQEMAGKYLRDREMTVVVVGDKKEVRTQVEPFGEVTE